MSSLSRLQTQLAAWDLHPKLLSDFTVRTKSGAVVSLIAITVAAALLVTEFLEYRTVEVVEHMEVDPIRGAQMRIAFEVIFPAAPCALLSLDLMDASGHAQVDVLHNIYKRRLDPEGKFVSNAELGQRSTIKNLAQLKNLTAGGDGAKPVRTDAAGNPCGDCYGAGAPDQCCNTCEEVRALYRKKGWHFNMGGVEQCSKEGFFGDVSAQLEAKEGCNVYGSFEVPKVPGNLHFAPSHSIQHAAGHVSDLVSFTMSSFNVSHKVVSLAFGQQHPGMHNVLDGVERVLVGNTGMQQYFVKLVPTVYKDDNGDEMHTYQYSVTEHLRKIDARTMANDPSATVMPGLFFHYELSPLRVRIESRRPSLGHFITRVCAIIGGVFTVMGVVDAILYKSLGAWYKGTGLSSGGMLGGGPNGSVGSHLKS